MFKPTKYMLDECRNDLPLQVWRFPVFSCLFICIGKKKKKNEK